MCCGKRGKRKDKEGGGAEDESNADSKKPAGSSFGSKRKNA
jgi:hypothetical protein